MKVYTVKAGDTLSKIANQFGTTVEAIRSANKETIKNVNNIHVGWRLSIPVSERSERDYEAIGKQFCKCMDSMDNIDGFDDLMKLVYGVTNG